MPHWCKSSKIFLKSSIEKGDLRAGVLACKQGNSPYLSAHGSPTGLAGHGIKLQIFPAYIKLIIQFHPNSAKIYCKPSLDRLFRISFHGRRLKIFSTAGARNLWTCTKLLWLNPNPMKEVGAGTYLRKLACLIRWNTLISSFRRFPTPKEPESRCPLHLKKSSGLRPPDYTLPGQASPG